MRVTKTELTKKEAEQITKLVDKLVTVNDFTLAVDFAKDAYVLFDEKFSKRKIFKSFWYLFKDIRNLYSKFKVGNLMKNVDFYNKVRTFLRYFITSNLFRELDKLDSMEALEKFLIMFKPPQPQSNSQSQNKKSKDKQEDKNEQKSKHIN